MTDLSDLYEEIILDHNKNPRFFNKVPENANRQAEGDNPLCGDHYSIQLRVDDGIVQSAGFEGAGCAISKASASLMLERIVGKTETEAINLFHSIHEMLTNNEQVTSEPADLGKLEVLGGVRKYPMRVKCATLAWHVLSAALNDTENQVSTE
jgi:nitrogen fixation protein NifU and related proteins